MLQVGLCCGVVVVANTGSVRPRVRAVDRARVISRNRQLSLRRSVQGPVVEPEIGFRPRPPTGLVRDLDVHDASIEDSEVLRVAAERLDQEIARPALSRVKRSGNAWPA